MATITIGENFSETGKLLKKISHKLELASDLDPLMELIGDARYVLLGEASHGTHEYYTWRTRLSKRLIAEKGFSFIAVEGDWPDCYRVNRFIKGYDNAGTTAIDVLKEFNRWPTWMWANWEIVQLVEWLQKHNKNFPANKRTGFYGIDVYSFWESMEFLLQYLKQKDPETLKAAEKVVQCFEPYGKDEGRSYARATYASLASCEDEIVQMLSRLRKNIAKYNTDYEAVFSASQNALVAVNAEKYYRAMVKAGAESWNIRDTHMVDTLSRLMEFHGPKAKAIVWEHNTHIGDARATDMKREGMVNVGQLVKEQSDALGVVRVGFGSYKGSVIAGREWGAPLQRMKIPPARDGSWEKLLHDTGKKNMLLLSRDLAKEKVFQKKFDHRAIGVVYNPEFERYGNYVPSLIPERYEAFIFLDETMGLHPLQVKDNPDQIPETYPWGE
ncbi:MAG TPA: erythromycin esterase family protein [Bacteroidia bacterium]|nr:erythromycin esterase family protein [Bacteroidia bacterium]